MFLEVKTEKNRNKGQTFEQGKPMNSQIIGEISPEGTSGLWRVGFIEKKGCCLY